nr:IS6 family transposase [Paraburkholderia franconis]
MDWLFNGRHFDREVIVLCVRWYLRYKLSLRDLVEMMAERGLSLAHTTIMRWVQRFTPEFVKRWNRFAVPAGQSWRVDKTYVNIHGKWAYPYCAVDRTGKTVDFRLSTRRCPCSQSLLREGHQQPGARSKNVHAGPLPASHRAVREMTDALLPDDTTVRSSKYLNNLIEQDHRHVKSGSTRCLPSNASGMHGSPRNLLHCPLARNLPATADRRTTSFGSGTRAGRRPHPACVNFGYSTRRTFPRRAISGLKQRLQSTRNASSGKAALTTSCDNECAPHWAQVVPAALTCAEPAAILVTLASQRALLFSNSVGRLHQSQTVSVIRPFSALKRVRYPIYVDSL